MSSPQDDALQEGNFGVDFVVHYKVPPAERAEAEAGFVQLVEALTAVGLATEVRHGGQDSLLIMVKMASADLLAQQVYRARLQDWLHGVRASAPDKDVAQALQSEPVTEAERLRLIYLMITKPKNEGGAGISPSKAKWKHVHSVFPLHNHAFNKAWIKTWGSKYLLDQEDLDSIRDKFGENVAFYFAFLGSYFRFLVIPSALGLGAWLLLGQFSSLYSLLCGLWSVVFFEYWKKKEVDLAVQWGVRGVSNIQQSRPEFEWEHEAEDAVTGEPIKVYPPLKRVTTQLLQIPFTVACVIALGSLIVTCNSLEVFINEVYTGPGKQYLGFLPTIFLVVGTPTISTLLMSAAEKLTAMENYATVDALIQKQFVLNFMTSYMAPLFTAFVYIPFGHILVPFLEFWRATAQTITFSEKPLPTREFQINPARITNQMFYFTVTAQIVNFVTEVIVPYVKQQAISKAKEFKTKGKQNYDHEEEVEFLERVRKECELEVYDVSGDYREMVMQFGSITSAAIVYLCSRSQNETNGVASQITGWGLLLSILLAEHFYLAAQMAARFVLSKLDSPGLQKERKERYVMKKKLLGEHLGQDVVATPGVATAEKITREALEEEARQTSIRGHGTPEEMFWQRQRGLQETIEVGRRMIEQQAAVGRDETKKTPAPSEKA
ncbi:hypothetical protein G7Z17_g10643 [Cylindrodendrum hubeiense]|uniref:Plasma membrane channel protein n=1 Tax=Cylindrodendrum hubeiense TaxID=595255 RepID=A0A9P5H5K5_9HYPO|nr:hypothetical protein G7Z17_g10643 [Cylindrodendrum hubeiense]